MVYDPSLFDALSNTLKEFVNIGSQVILACTERNSATLEMFLQKIGNYYRNLMKFFPTTSSITVVNILHYQS